jgi:hypothetical protein
MIAERHDRGGAIPSTDLGPSWKWLITLPLRAVTLPRKEMPAPTAGEVKWAEQSVGAGWPARKSITVFRHAASHFTIWTNFTCKWNDKQNKTNSVVLSPRANYTDWATATCWWNLVPTFADRGVSRGQRGGSPTVVNLSCLDRSRYFSFT